MVLLKSCCCWRSVRSGSFASGIYTLGFYTIVVTAGSFHVRSIVSLPVYIPVLLIFSILMIVFASLSIISSVLLIVGLCRNNRLLLIPWIVCISMTTILDVILSLYLVTDSEIDPFFAVLVATDLMICALNVYCILCVTSQYQEYSIGRGRPRQMIVDARIPDIHFEPASVVRQGGERTLPSPKVSVSVIKDNEGSPTHLISQPLLTDSPVYQQQVSSAGLVTSTSPVFMGSRSSFSSTTEISFCSSDALPGSRRGSEMPFPEIVRPGLSPVGEASKVFPDEDEESHVETMDDKETDTTISGDCKSGSDFSLQISSVTARLGTSGKFPSSIFRQIPIKMPILENTRDEDTEPISRENVSSTNDTFPSKK